MSRRLRGPAARAEAARRALGVATHASGEHGWAGELPVPVIHAALALAVCALATLVRPQTMGLQGSMLATAALALATAGATVIYDRFIFAEGTRPPLESTAVPAAAVIAYVTVLGATTSVWLRVVAAAAATAAVGLTPYLAARRHAAGAAPLADAFRDAVGILVLLPGLVAGVSLDQPLALRALLVGTPTLLVTLDALRSEDLSRRWSLLGSLLISALVGAAALVASGSSPGVRAGPVLVVWYGLRGLVLSLAAGRRGVTLILEYLGVVSVAALVLVAIQGR